MQIYSPKIILLIVKITKVFHLYEMNQIVCSFVNSRFCCRLSDISSSFLLSL